MGEIIFCSLFVLACYVCRFIYKFITVNKETHDENDFAIIEYANEEVKLFKNLKTGIYEEIRQID